MLLLNFTASEMRKVRSGRIWKHDERDMLLLLIGVAQICLIALTVVFWQDLSIAARAVAMIAVALGHWYCIAIVGHFYIHTGWFVSGLAERLAALLVSLSMGQSASAYRLSHVRNHHRYGNDRQDAHGKTCDLSSTFRHAPPGQHRGLLAYVLGGAVETFWRELGLRMAVAVMPFGFVPKPVGRLPLSRGQSRRVREVHSIGLELGGLSLVWWALLILRPGFAICYGIALLAAFALVNLQNYFEHFGACPEVPEANSVSHYGALYNRMTFNDGYHQEHHLRPAQHWSQLPELRGQAHLQQADVEPVVSPWPAVLGFLDRGRPRLDRDGAAPECRASR